MEAQLEAFLDKPRENETTNGKHYNSDGYVIEQYSDKSIVLRHYVKDENDNDVVDNSVFTKYSNSIGTLGSYNKGLRGGQGWIFSNNKKNDLIKMVEDIKSGNIKQSESSSGKYQSITIKVIKPSFNDKLNVVCKDKTYVGVVTSTTLIGYLVHKFTLKIDNVEHDVKLVESKWIVDGFDEPHTVSYN